jgi:hypothetical protein
MHCNRRINPIIPPSISRGIQKILIILIICPSQPNISFDGADVPEDAGLVLWGWIF